MVDKHHLEGEWGFLLVDAMNTFTKGKLTAMLWTVRHDCPSSAQFEFNCYCHLGTLVCQGLVQALILYIKEGETQEDPLAMAIYGLGLLPLINALARRVPGTHQQKIPPNNCS